MTLLIRHLEPLFLRLFREDARNLKMLPVPSASLERAAGLPAALILVLLPVLAACGGTGPLVSEPPGAARTAQAPGDVERALRAEAQSWHGTPYRYGGTSRDGIDCSAFVQTLYRDAFGLRLPRRAAQQAQEGVAVTQGTNLAGDLVFFLTEGGKTRHVGIFLGRGEFVHASTSAGVTISRLDDPYWQDAYWTTRRVLHDARPAASAPGSSRPTRGPRPATRAGW